MRKITWLASYVKSGSTWFRLLMENYLAGAVAPADINCFKRTAMANSRAIFDAHAGFDSSLFTHDEIESLLPGYYRHLADKYPEGVYLKTHDAYIRYADKEPLMPVEATNCALYLVRNPLDVAVSFSHHFGFTIDKTIDCMADESVVFSGHENELLTHFRLKMLSWSGHVRSWRDAEGVKVKIIRYEDLLADPLETFCGALAFAGMEIDREVALRAIEFASFKNLKQQEKSKGFSQRNSASKVFFRKGSSGGWRHEMTREQSERILSGHYDVMKHLGYLDEKGSPLF